MNRLLLRGGLFGSATIIILPLALTAAGETIHPWRLAWMIPAFLAGYWLVIWGLSRLRP